MGKKITKIERRVLSTIWVDELDSARCNPECPGNIDSEGTLRGGDKCFYTHSHKPTPNRRTDLCIRAEIGA
ncbi:MAG: hypothetical protein HY849_04760 [Nitrosomonadales bacterium]|nr:hypothetical protein [Nitrosomonadales bacterium]